jgi:ATP-dependent helicase/nuclease subunit A
VHRDEQGNVQWGLSLPSKDICAADETLGAARESLRARQAYEQLCVLYVAMSRAKHALYCLRAPASDLKNPGRWLNDFFPMGDGKNPDNRTLGDPMWFAAYRPKKLEAVEIKGGRIHQAKRQIQEGCPSSHEGEDVPVGLILGGGAARHLGMEVHELLAQVEWLGDEPDWSGATAEASGLVREFLGSDRAAALKKPEENLLLWRERAFDVEIEGRPLSGIFDRVQIELGPGGEAVAAKVYDFKTDKGPVDLHAKYKNQLDSYAVAAAHLLGIPGDRVHAEPLRVRAPQDPG